jgi:hypothetical protein
MRSAKQTTSQVAAPNVRKALPSSRANKGLDKDELAFLPAALEIVETPPYEVADVGPYTLRPKPALLLCGAASARARSRASSASRSRSCNT